jgi:sugar O-acyltransferase (sialic acid O-acetyltransferase NeuD family)
MSKILAILGAGELGIQIANFALKDKHYDTVYFYDDLNISENIKGNTEDLISHFDLKLIDEVLIGIGYNHLDNREKKFNYLKGKVKFGKIIHTTSWVDESAVIRDGSVIYPRCIIDKNVIIKENTILNLNCTIAHDTIIGSSCFLGPSVSIAGFCSIENQCFLGINSTVKDNIKIIQNTIIGAGTLVVKNIIEKGIYIGNPNKKTQKDDTI